MAATKGFTNHLSLAACEWLLMFLMFIDAALAYFLTKFAHYCKLQVPCLFCLRLDHLFGNEEPGSYLSLFCTKHQADVSYLISCDLHNKLADVREMCDDCFMSLMLGPIGKEGYQRSYLNKNFVRVPSTTGACSCCKRQWKAKAKSSAQRLIQPNPVGLGASTVTVKPPLPRVSGRSRFSRRDSFKRARDKVSGTMGVDTLSHVGYTELRITSDSESEVPFSDDDDASVVSRGTIRNNQEKVYVRHSHSTSDPGFLENVHLDESIASRSISLASNGSIGHDLGELNGPKVQSRSSPYPPSELTPQNGDVELPLGASADKFSAGHVSPVPNDTDTTVDQRTLSTNEGGEIDPLKTEKDTKSLPSIISTQEMNSSSHIKRDLSSSSLDKNDGYEYLDGSSVGEIEGEDVVEKLKRQVEYDRKCMESLQSELEEERNAAAIAANQAMAMITRLQEEKASLHMEALQYLRMMEEQAEYDMEALQKANDLLDEKEKEIQDLEAELESYQNDFDETENLKNGKIQDKPTVVNAPILDIEDEKRYILQCLSELERKFHHFSSPQTSTGMSNGDIDTARTTNEVETTEDFQEDHLKDEKSLSRHEDLSTSHENENHVDYRKKLLCVDGGEVDLATFENEISDLNERLEALEADRDFLEHACNTLHNSGGLQFIQEIARQLQDLRRIRFDRKDLSIT